ncbi:E3 ubiquitin-protein ligase znrf2-like isoform X2 [Brachionichthys hirsutus]|uniref:E3 ubiquitin-protein ligase znrf2-like isoform X2 n=1 Tax=Brachionichthys hirsutus TaxID=412623 RepID=UPI003604D7F9
MGGKQSSPMFEGRARAYSSSDVPSGNSSAGERIAGFRYTNGPDGPRIRYTGGGGGGGGAASTGISISSGSQVLNESLDGTEGDEDQLAPEGHRLLIGSLPAHLSPRLLGGFHCPVCSKFMASDEIEKHLLMCFSKTRLTYNTFLFYLSQRTFCPETLGNVQYVWKSWSRETPLPGCPVSASTIKGALTSGLR